MALGGWLGAAIGLRSGVTDVSQEDFYLFAGLVRIFILCRLDYLIVKVALKKLPTHFQIHLWSAQCVDGVLH